MSKGGTPYRFSKLSERKRFYNKEFDIKKVKKWFKDSLGYYPQICAIDAGSETGIIVNKKYKGEMFYFFFDELQEKIKKYVPEDVYFDRNIYSNPEKILETLQFKKPVSQMLAFDIDADNIECENHSDELEVCQDCIKKTYNYALDMKKGLSRRFKKIKLVYSGRGFHIYILDKKAFKLDFKERSKLNKQFSKYPIDPWVSRGHIRLMRLPYSLNGLVSRIVIPIGTSRKFNEKKTIPKFLRR